MSAHSSPRPPPSVVTPGNHDGVHLGHRALIDATRARADAKGWRALGMCFDPHPTSVLAAERAPTLLTRIPRRVELMKGAGCDEVAVLPFDEEFARTPPEVFVERVLVEVCNARGVVVGPDFHFGHRRAGNIDTLRKLGERYDFDVEVVQPVIYDGEPVSSTRIRRVLREDGDVALASRMLTRVPEGRGRVVVGDRRGRQIGFPTANLDCGPTQLPADGVYAVVARDLSEPAGGRLAGVANLGDRPTFEAGRSVEVYLFDFDGDLYGHDLRVGFVERIRGEVRFDGLDALVAQIGRDVERGRHAVAEVDKTLLRWI